MTTVGALPPLTYSVVLVPVKAFKRAKKRLSPSLDPSHRARLARLMAEHVLSVAHPLTAAVVCDDEEVATWAGARGAVVLREPGRGLNGAVATGVARLASAGAGEIVIAHSDLPHAGGLARLTGFDGVTLVPDRQRNGTNVLCLPAGVGFRFSYGPGSFARHAAEARRLRLSVRVLYEPDLAWDVDVPADIPSRLAPFT